MRGENFNVSEERSHKRKRQRADKLLNISIGIVVLLILLVGAQFLLGGNSDSPVVSDELGENNNEIAEEDNDTGEPNEPVVKEEPQSSEEPSNEPSSEQSPENTETSNEDTELDSNTTDQELDNLMPEEGQWKPIGTVQQEPFTAVYEKNHVNWGEMTKAFQYATGLEDDMVLWHVGNGGNHESAVGIVANYSTRTTPYKVRIEWVTNEGWKPVSVEQLDDNQYLTR